MSTEAFLRDRIAITKDQIVALEDAIQAVTVEGIQSYSLDTGQTKQNVTLHDVNRLQTQLDSLYNRLVTLESRVNGGGSFTTRPCW